MADGAGQGATRISDADELAILYDSAPIGLAIVDAEGRYLRVNACLAEINGVSADDHVGRTFAEVAPDVAARIGNAVEEVAAGRSVRGLVFEAETPARPGERRSFRVNVVPFSSGGATMGASITVEELTQAREAEAEKARLSVLLDTIGETTPDAIYAKDLDGRMLYANPATCEIIGYPADRIIGASEEDWGNDPDEARAIREVDQRVMRSGRQEIAEEAYTSPDGTARVFRSAKTPIRGADGLVMGVAGVSSDITALKQAEAAAARAAADFEALAENVNQHVWIADADGHMLWLNQRWHNYSGMSAEEIEAGHWETIHHPDHLARVRAKWDEHIGRGLRWEDTFPLRGMNGEYRWFLSRAEPVRDASGETLRWFGTNTDVTEQLETAGALQRSEALFRTASEALPGLLFVATAEQGNIYVNEEYRRYTGRSEAELLGLGCMDCVCPDDRESLMAAWNRASMTGAVYEGEWRIRRNDGAYRWHLVRGLPVAAGAGAVDRWVGVCIDIHDRRLAQDELQRRVDEVVADREVALFQLHEAQKLETIGQLTGGVAHDFNNLLTPIVGSLDILRRRTDEERSVRLIEGALTSAERARVLIQRLLAFARRQTLQPRPVDPRAVVDGMRELIERSLGPRITFATEVSKDVPPALVDPNQLELALLNLSVNARDAMPQGGVLRWTVTSEDVRVARGELEPGRYVRIAVEDDGEGMAAETLARAVEPFFSTKVAGQGTGLGLSMVHGLAAQSGGAFRLESVVGEGTTALLWLPVGMPEQAEIALAPGDDRRAARRALVLLVDDEPQVRFTTAESLKELGYEVEATGSGQEALDRVADGLTPDLLVTDHLMPGMTGAQLAMELRQDLPDLPVLMITGYAQLRPEEAGDFDVLTKPYRHAELALRIADLLAEQPVLQRALS